MHSTDEIPSEEQARVRLTLGFKDWVGGAPAEYWYAQFEMPRTEAEGIRAAEEKIVHESRASFSISDRRSCTSWGADSGEVIEVLLFVGKSAADGAIAAAILALWKRMATRGGPVYRELNMTEAIERAKWIVVNRYADSVRWSGLELPTTTDELILIGDAHDKSIGTWTITLADRAGFQYRVTIAAVDGLPSCEKVERWQT